MILLRKYLLLTVVLLITVCTNAQITHRDLLQKAIGRKLESMLLAKSSFKPFPQTPQGWRAILPDTVVTGLIRRGEAAQQKTFNNIPATTMLDFSRNGNRTNYERLSFEKRNQLMDLVMAESVEGKGRFTDQIVNGIWSICEESFWGISAHVGMQKAGIGLPDVQEPVVDLFAAETGAVLAWADYFVGTELDKASKLVRERMRYEISRRILTPMTTAKYGYLGDGNPEAKLSNWAPWVASNYLTIALLTEQDEARRLQAVNIAIKITDQYINGLGTDGGCEEGPSYWTAAAGCVYDALDLLNDATGEKLNIYKDPFIQKMGSYIFKTHIAGDYFINVADAHPTLIPDGLMIYRFGRDMNYQPMENFGSWAYHTFPNENTGIEQFHRTRNLYNLTAIKTCASYPYKEMEVPDAWYSDVQLMASRSDNGLFVAAHGGTNGESHNHNDVGDFIVYADSYPVIIDVGSGTYTSRTFSKDRYKLWFNTSPYHNLPTINGQEQQEGLKYAASAVNYTSNQVKSQLTMDIAKAYLTDAGINKWHRSIIMHKNQGIVVTDNYSLSKNESLTQSFMTICNINLNAKGKIIFNLPNHTKVYLDYDPMFWAVSKEKIDLKTPEDQGLKHTWNGKDIYRVLLTAISHDLTKAVIYNIHK